LKTILLQPLLVWRVHYSFSNEMRCINLRFAYFTYLFAMSLSLGSDEE